MSKIRTGKTIQASSILVVLLFAGFNGASADTPAQPITNQTSTDSVPASAETITRQTPSAPETPRKPKPAAPAKKTRVRLGPQVDPCLTVTVAGDTWLDQVHGFVQDSTCEPAVWFDTFFVKDHILLDLRPGMFIVLRNGGRLIEGHSVAYVREYRFEWKLPQWQNLLKRWKIYIESASDANKYTTQPGQPAQPGVDPKTGEKKSIVGVRADLYTRFRSQITIDSGIRISIHPDAFVRMRYQYAQTFGEAYLFRFSEIAMRQAVERFTNTTQLDLERKLTAFSLIRWGNNVTFSEDVSGITWNTGPSLFTQLTPKSAISYDASIWGVNHPGWIVQNYRVGSHYRRNFYRPYLFFELDPEVTWPKDVKGDRKPVYAFMATLEIQFGK